ncbi:iron chaperone [Phenylobacterium sp.]|uniref:iron chaperone n=1 Tax=Phenylobacterium sp. TaxID=1871053 RepID=UPI002CD9D42B|nr:DUF1801 domain-containing protein [Phenylobacterium sp.]HLZ73888.1 DUF1801 domain-containing protein [Phenylobacterium sp.]
MKTRTSSPPPTSVEGYIERCEPQVQAILRKIRATIRREAPEAAERLSYNMPTFFLGRVLVHYGAFKGHIGLFPPVREPALQDKVAPYRGEKGNLRFPLDQPIPYELIGEIVAARIKAASAG